MSENIERTVNVSAALANIATYNIGLSLNEVDLKDIAEGNLYLAGFGSDRPLAQLPQQIPGVLLPPTFPSLPTERGCITHMIFGTGSNDLDGFSVDGHPYAPSNVKDFQEILVKAACCGWKINFCINHRTGLMTMLNVYPQLCCECKPQHVVQ